jgi:hypothetical protein
MTRIVSGGGINSNKTTSAKGSQKVEPRSRAINPASVSTMGLAVQFKKPELEMGPGYKSKPEGDTGLRGKYNSATSGPGSLRTTYAAGSQSATPAAREMSPSRDVFMERPNKSNRP